MAVNEQEVTPCITVADHEFQARVIQDQIESWDTSRGRFVAISKTNYLMHVDAILDALLSMREIAQFELRLARAEENKRTRELLDGPSPSRRGALIRISQRDSGMGEISESILHVGDSRTMSPMSMTSKIVVEVLDFVKPEPLPL